MSTSWYKLCRIKSARTKIPMTRKFLLSIIIYITLICVLLYLCFTIIRDEGLFSVRYRWTIQQIVDYLGTSLPGDATNITSDSSIVYGFYIRLQFSASPESVLEFSNHICRGILRQGYDPFNSVIVTSSPDAYLIDMRGYSYFSISPNTAPEISGNVCVNSQSHVHQIAINTSISTLYHLRFEVPSPACDDVRVKCYSMPSDPTFYNTP